MLCPECERSYTGGAICPHCGHQVPERESFSSQGAHYLRLLSAFSLLLLVIFALATSLGTGLAATLRRLYQTGWLWFYLAIFLIPLVIGLYYWFMLREEEISVTDQYIERQSRWGDQSFLWAEISGFHETPILFQDTRLGRIAGLSRYFREGSLFLNLPKMRYELVGPPDAAGNPAVMYLEPGNIDDLPWLLKLIEEHLGPPTRA